MPLQAGRLIDILLTPSAVIILLTDSLIEVVRLSSAESCELKMGPRKRHALLFMRDAVSLIRRPTCMGFFLDSPRVDDVITTRFLERRYTRLLESLIFGWDREIPVARGEILKSTSLLMPNSVLMTMIDHSVTGS